MAGNTVFTAGAMALLGGGVRAAFVEYSTYQNNNCVDVISTSVYTGVPTLSGVETADTCLAYEESTTTTFVSSGLTDGNGILSLQHVCNTTTAPGVLTNMWYATDDCDDTAVQLEFSQDVCTASCTEVEPDYGSDVFGSVTVTFYDTASCTNATDTGVYTGMDLYELYGVDGTSCTPSGAFDYYTVIHCSGGSPAAVYYEDDACDGDMVGMTYNAGCAPVPSNGTYPGDYFMAECTEGAAADDDGAGEDVDGASSGAPSLVAGVPAGGLVAACAAAAAAGVSAGIAAFS